MFKRVIFFIFFLLFSVNSFGLDYVPNELYKWKDWVIKGYEDKLCPQSINDKNICNWYTEVILSRENNIIRFTQEVKIEKDQTIKIVGDKDYIVDFVVVTNKANNKVDQIPVIYINNYPTINLLKGEYKIQGFAESKELKNEISIPPEITSVLIMDSQSEIRLAEIKNNVVYWNNIPEKLQKEEKLQNNSKNITVFREVIDGIPVKVNTYIRLFITGEERVLNIENILLNNFEVVSYYSNVPLNINNDDLNILVKNGSYLIKIEEISTESLPLTINNSNHEGLWVFKEDNNVRSVLLENIRRVNTNQFGNIPFNVNNSQAFYMNKNEKLKFKQLKKGIEENKNENISVVRDLWLSFSGKDLFFRDRINVSNISRINYKKDNELGNVKIENQDAYISVKDNKEGFEIRNNRANIIVQGKVNNKINKEMNILGIDRNISSYSMNIHLPPGWSVFHVVNGEIYNSYINKWKLLDFFMVFLISAIVFKMWGFFSSIIVMITMFLIYHNPLFNSFILINSMIAVILYKFSINFIEKNYKKRLLQFYSIINLFILTVLFFTFLIITITQTIYPDLNKNFININKYNSMDMRGMALDSVSNTSLSVRENYRVIEEATLEMSSNIRNNFDINESVIIKNFNENLNPQTGYGIPAINWNTYRINWNSNISNEEKFKLILISPNIQKIINIFSILGWVYLIFLLIRHQIQTNIKKSEKE